MNCEQLGGQDKCNFSLSSSGISEVLYISVIGPGLMSVLCSSGGSGSQNL